MKPSRPPFQYQLPGMRLCRAFNAHAWCFRDEVPPPCCSAECAEGCSEEAHGCAARRDGQTVACGERSHSSLWHLRTLGVPSQPPGFAPPTAEKLAAWEAL